MRGRLSPRETHELCVKVLSSSGIEVVTIHDDFAAYYEMFPLGSGDRWYSAQLTSADGSDLGTRCDFGTAHLPDDLNRVNFVMCELIAKRAASFEDDLNAMRSPWSHEYVDKIRIFSATWCQRSRRAWGALSPTISRTIHSNRL